jgi:hypothetical protein
MVKILASQKLNLLGMDLFLLLQQMILLVAVAENLNEPKNLMLLNAIKKSQTN